jgi:hypothetical protein
VALGADDPLFFYILYTDSPFFKYELVRMAVMDTECVNDDDADDIFDVIVGQFYNRL